MQNLPLEDQIREIKKMLRATMNGVLSGSMRQQGLTYRVNFGVDQPRLIELSDEIPHTAALAAKLWKEDIRELRLLAPMLMPRDEMDEELALLWIEQLHFAEEAQVLVMHLLCHLPFASDIAFRLVASDHLESELTAQGNDPELQRTALNTLYKFIDLGAAETARGERLLESLS